MLTYSTAKSLADAVAASESESLDQTEHYVMLDGDADEYAWG